jgi:hypothetical protein
VRDVFAKVLRPSRAATCISFGAITAYNAIDLANPTRCNQMFLAVMTICAGQR